jgi:hypothetical protein
MSWREHLEPAAFWAAIWAAVRVICHFLPPPAKPKPMVYPPSHPINLSPIVSVLTVLGLAAFYWWAMGLSDER